MSGVPGAPAFPEGVAAKSGALKKSDFTLSGEDVREGLTAFVDLKDFTLKRWTDKKYYEVCVNEALYKHMESAFPVV